MKKETNGGKDAMEGKAPNKNKDFSLILRGHTYKR